MHWAKSQVISPTSLRFISRRLSEKKNGQLGDFEVAPDFYNGGVYKPIDQNNKRFEVIKDNNIPF
jgi:hypothetical protein